MKFLLLIALTVATSTGAKAQSCTDSQDRICLGRRADSLKYPQPGQTLNQICKRDFGWAKYTQAYSCDPSGRYACGLPSLGEVNNGLGDFVDIPNGDTCDPTSSIVDEDVHEDAPADTSALRGFKIVSS